MVSEPVPSVGDAAAQQREAVVTAERAKERSTPAAPTAAPPTAWISPVSMLADSHMWYTAGPDCVSVQ